jgi:DNA-binding IclR family transcriptional regulator
MRLSSLDKSLQVIELLSKNPQGVSLTRLTELLGFPNSTIHHILSTFRYYDYVDQDPETKKYMLSFKFLSISSRILDQIDIRRTAYNELRTLFQTCNETVHLSILRNGMVTYIDKVQKPGGLSLATYIGFSTDPHAAAGGKILLSELPHSQVEYIYRDRPLKRYGKNTITNMAQLFEELENIRKLGYAIDNEEYYEGVRCVAAPIRAGGKIVAAISVTGSIFSLTMEKINQGLIGLVVGTAKDISSKMQW